MCGLYCNHWCSVLLNSITACIFGDENISQREMPGPEVTERFNMQQQKKRMIVMEH